MAKNGFFRRVLEGEPLQEAFENSKIYHSEAVSGLFSQMDSNHTANVLRNYASQVEKPDARVMWAIIFHDSGKTFTHTVGPNGVNHYYGHQEKSAELFDELKDEVQIPQRDAEYIRDLVRWHDDEIGLKLTRQMYDKHDVGFFKDFFALKSADINDHDEPMRSKRLKEIEEFLPRLKSNLIKLEHEKERELKDIKTKEARLSEMRDVTGANKTRDEEKGVTEKLWLDVDGREALFKITQFRRDNTHTNAHYAELFVSEFCKASGVPASDIELAHDENNIGCLSYNFLKPGDEMTDFNEILSEIRPDFNSKKLAAENTNESYSVPLILEGVEHVSTTPEEFSSLKKQFLQYCLIYSAVEHYNANPSNISVIQNENGASLAPMLDNGTSLDLAMPKQVADENFSKEWMQQLRTQNLSKIGVDKRYCQYGELESHIFSKYYKDVEPLLQRMQTVNVDKILSSPSYNGLDDTYKDMIRTMVSGNINNMLERAEQYKQNPLLRRSLKQCPQTTFALDLTVRFRKYKK